MPPRGPHVWFKVDAVEFGALRQVVASRDWFDEVAEKLLRAGGDRPLKLHRSHVEGLLELIDWGLATLPPSVQRFVRELENLQERLKEVLVERFGGPDFEEEDVPRPSASSAALAKIPKRKRPVKPKEVFQFRVALDEVRPTVWRRFQILDCSLETLNEYIRAAMGWHGIHLYEFRIQDCRYSSRDEYDSGYGDCYEDARPVRLAKLFPAAALPMKFHYAYDLGDYWRHRVAAEKRFPAEPGVEYPRCIAGKNRCPPEDCGGAGGYEGVLKIVADPSHPEHASYKGWLARTFDATEFDPRIVTARMARVAAY